MKSHEEQRVVEIARHFADLKADILRVWLALLREHAITTGPDEERYFEHGFRTLLDDFTTHLARGDFAAYYAGNRRIGEEIAFNDLPFRKFIAAFHLFEESYAKLLTDGARAGELLRSLGALDQLHHDTIAIVGEAYFDVKDATIFSLAKLAELRDPEGAFHLERTREYAVALARAVGLDQGFIDAVYRVGPLHDIGKVGVPDAILHKPGPLTSEEYAEMKRHTVYGARTIESIIGTQPVSRGYLHVAREICLYHHERYDGAGYPEGLRGEAIPLAARLFALGDAYDTIVSKRRYKEALPHAVAVERIVGDAGKHFDPSLVAAFERVQGEFGRIAAAYRE